MGNCCGRDAANANSPTSKKNQVVANERESTEKLKNYDVYVAGTSSENDKGILGCFGTESKKMSSDFSSLIDRSALTLKVSSDKNFLYVLDQGYQLRKLCLNTKQVMKDYGKITSSDNM